MLTTPVPLGVTYKLPFVSVVVIVNVLEFVCRQPDEAFLPIGKGECACAGVFSVRELFGLAHSQCYQSARAVPIVFFGLGELIRRSAPGVF